MKRMISVPLTVMCLFLVLFLLTQKQQGEDSVVQNIGRDLKTEGKEVKGVQTAQEITVEEAYEKLKSDNILLLDVRTDLEFEREQIPHATKLNAYEELDPEVAYIVYCRVGNRSRVTMYEMARLGFREVYNMQGGIEAWKNLGFPTL